MDPSMDLSPLGKAPRADGNIINKTPKTKSKRATTMIFPEPDRPTNMMSINLDPLGARNTTALSALPQPFSTILLYPAGASASQTGAGFCKWSINPEFATAAHMQGVGGRLGIHVNSPGSGHGYSNEWFISGPDTTTISETLEQSPIFDSVPTLDSPTHGLDFDWVPPLAQIPHSLPGFDLINNTPWTSVNGSGLMQPLGFRPDLNLDAYPLPIPPIVHDTDTSSATPTCLCGKEFSRKDALLRHIGTASRRSIQSFSALDASELYPCNLCDKHQGINGFKRRDHLRQHLGIKGYHKMNKAAVDEYFNKYH
ncbi:hypothetical protein B0T14DRAFT_559090 [Immersiella caudata]|uniref:C2H2-type domain-containing protein n=1 Tax=Immersiella caudata TaxID=314043 RepID=A0AA39XC98_9PEZI|nr:hypothetical protein B0T14DRAFT_559090 [Immersiella caudata]